MKSARTASGSWFPRRTMATRLSELHFGGVPFHPDKRVAIVRRGNQLPDAVRALFIGHANPQALGFQFEFALKNELAQDLLRVEWLERSRKLPAAFNLLQLLADVENADRLVADLRERIRSRTTGIALRHQVEKHAEGN